jgi:hypothetical protein
MPASAAARMIFVSFDTVDISLAGVKTGRNGRACRDRPPTTVKCR